MAIVPDFYLTRFPNKPGVWQLIWWVRLSIDCATAVLSADLYEADTDKVLSDRVTHDADGALGAAMLFEASIHWTWTFHYAVDLIKPKVRPVRPF